MTKTATHAAATGGNSSVALFVRFTTSGSTFSPIVGLISGATTSISWYVEETQSTVTGLSPSFNFGSSGTRHVQLKATGGNRLHEVELLNLGYDNTQDFGTYSLSSSYNHPSQGVTNIENLSYISHLKYFLAAQTTGTSASPLACALDFTGFSSLLNIEVFDASITGITLTGCTALQRLCVENNNLTTINVNPVLSNLFELRAAIQQGGSLTFTTLTGDMTNLYHFCVRDQTIVNMPPFTRFPAITELWVWNTGITGTVTITNPIITSLQIFSNPLTNVVITGESTLTDIRVDNCSFDSTKVDTILSVVNGYGTSSSLYNLNVGTNNSSPTNGTGQPLVTSLRSRSWGVDFTNLWEDTFDRANATGLAVVNNGWVSSVGTATADISSHDLIKTDSGSYTVLTNPTNVTLPADYTVTTRIPGATLGTFIGIVGRWSGGEGVQLFFNNGFTSADIVIANASGFLLNSVYLTTLNAFPASWSNTSIDHTFAMKMVGSTITAILDGVEVVSGTLPSNSTTTGTGVGICGEGRSRAWHDICVTA